uniref:Uncharacterized protein DDB_G0271670-like n=1 Tax=Dermatophagoides pteronyssinus TaxID=6956 RepID=A0A6P6XNK5_DERPT
MAAKDNFPLLFSLIILLPTLCFTQFFDSHQSKIDPFVKRVLTSTTNVGSVGGGGSSRFDLMIEPPVSGVEMYHSLSQQQQQQSDQISDNQSNSTTTTTPHSIRIIATQNGSLYGIKANDDNQITNNNDGDMLNSSGTTSNQNFIIPDQIMPYMNAYSTHLNSDLKQLSSGSMIGNQVKPISNDDVFIVHHQHHYPPMFMNSESSIQSAGSTNQASSIIQQNGGGSSNLSPATQTSFRPLKKMQKSNKKKSKKLQIVYIKVPLLNLMDGTSAPTSTTTMTTKSATSKHHTSMEIDDSDSESQEDTIDTTISLSATPDSTTTTTTTTTTTPKPELFINDNNNDNKQQWNKREHSTSSTN